LPSLKINYSHTDNLLLYGYTVYWPMWTTATVDSLMNWPVMVNRVPPAFGPYNGRTLSTDIWLSDTAEPSEKDI